MNFDLDDPLGSDDSFFEEPKALARRPSASKTTEKKSLENLFNLTDSAAKENVETEKKAPEIFNKPKSFVTFDESTIQQDVNTKRAKPDYTSKPQKKNDDWLGELETTLDKKSKKTDFLDDILPSRPTTSKDKKVTSFEDILKDSKANTVPKPSGPQKEASTPTDAMSNFSLLSGTSRDRRRVRRGSSTAIEDTLGLFGDDYQSGDFYSKDSKLPASKPASTEFPAKTATSSEKAIPDWLGGSMTEYTKPDAEFSKKSESQIKDNTETEMKKTAGEEPQTETKKSAQAPEKSTEDIPMALKQQHINMELQNTYASLQQQESFLLISLQLKKYEENLEVIKQQQQEILGKQEKQFSAILDQYIVKQQMIENNIRLQQERINSHMQMLIAHQPLNHSANNSEDHDVESNKTITPDETEKNIEIIIRSLKQRHNEELFINEESYKKQISILEQSTQNLEERLRNEMTNITTIFEDKINTTSKNNKDEITYYKQKISTIEEQHSDDMKLLKENHMRALEEMKVEYAVQIETIKQFKKHETELLNDGSSYSQKLDTGIEMLNSNTKALQVLQEKAVNNYDIISIARENSIETKEKEIILMRNALEKCRDAAENERSQLLALIRSLETKIAEQSNNGREDRWAMQQASATLVARSAALEREAEYNRSIIEREREQLKTLKESLLAEQEKILLQLTEEKLLISAEKARIETSSKLTNNYESEKMKTEAETAIQVAKELTSQITGEREHLSRQRAEVETLRRQLTDRERELEDKERELDYLTQNAQKKINEDKRIINEAKRMENMYKQRLQELQSQWISVSNREKKLAEEKVLLSKERLALYTSIKQTKKCVLCKADEQLVDNDLYQVINSQDDLINNKIGDTDIIRFRLDANEDERNSEVSKEENNFNPYEI